MLSKSMRLCACASLLLLAACGGGGSGGPTLPASPTTTATPSPSPTPTPNPTASGDSFKYTGSVSQTVTIYATPAPNPTSWGGSTPAPTATPWVSTTNQSVTQNVSVATGQSFNSQNNLTEFTTQETDAGQLQTTSVASHQYLSYAADATRVNGVDVTEIGTSSTDSNGVALQSVPGSGNGVVLKLPYVTNGQWTNSPARTDTENDPDGETIASTYAADGTYQEQFTYPEGSAGSVLTREDGSGVYDTPLEGIGSALTSITVEPPSGNQIIVGLTIPPADEAIAFTLNDWYPVAPPNFASDTYVDKGPTTVPSSCNVGSAYQSVGVEEFVETKTRLDTVFGEYETDQVTQYVSSYYGLLCEVVNDNLQNYYDYSGQAGSGFAFTYQTPAAPVDTTVVSETLALQSEQSATTASAHRTTRSFAQQPSFSAILPRPSLARARMIIAAAHERHARTLITKGRSGSARRQTP